MKSQPADTQCPGNSQCKWIERSNGCCLWFFFGRKYTNETTCRIIGHLGIVHRLRATPQWAKKVVRKSSSMPVAYFRTHHCPQWNMYDNYETWNMFAHYFGLSREPSQSTKSCMPEFMNQHVCQARELFPPSCARRIDLFDSRLQLFIADSACLHVKLAAASFSESRSQIGSQINVVRKIAVGRRR